MRFSLVSNWWAVVLRGVVAILFAVLAFAWPGPTLAVLVYLFGAYALVDGVFAVATAVSGHPDGQSAWALAVEGVVGIGIGVATFFWPAITAVALLYLIAFWAVATGVLEIIAAFSLRKHVPGEWVLALSGVLSIVFGFALLFFPIGEALLTVVWLIGAYALAFGVLLVVLGFQLRNHHRFTGVSRF
jgi:uncharacterized membrane protein HdeD (DUF308 family)